MVVIVVLVVINAEPKNSYTTLAATMVEQETKKTDDYKVDEHYQCMHLWKNYEWKEDDSHAKDGISHVSVNTIVWCCNVRNPVMPGMNMIV